jgi:hypothetical protein
MGRINLLALFQTQAGGINNTAALFQADAENNLLALFQTRGCGGLFVRSVEWSTSVGNTAERQEDGYRRVWSRRSRWHGGVPSRE